MKCQLLVLAVLVAVMAAMARAVPMTTGSHRHPQPPIAVDDDAEISAAIDAAEEEQQRQPQQQPQYPAVRYPMQPQQQMPPQMMPQPQQPYPYYPPESAMQYTGPAHLMAQQQQQQQQQAMDVAVDERLIYCAHCRKNVCARVKNRASMHH